MAREAEAEVDTTVVAEEAVDTTRVDTAVAVVDTAVARAVVEVDGEIKVNPVVPGEPRASC